MALSKITNASVADTAVHGRRNLVINGAMICSQRGTSTSAVTATGYYSVDRFKVVDQISTVVTTVSQSTDAATGFVNSKKIDVTTANASPSANEYFAIQQLIEAQDLKRLQYGTSTAKSLTLSFYVKSPKTGTHYAELENSGGQFFSKPYTINSANTWEYKTLTFAGNTSQALINSGNSTGLAINFWLVAGSAFQSGTHSEVWTTTNANRLVGQVNVLDDAANDFFLTGVQLEVGETASPFEHRSYGDELARCQRYYVEAGIVLANATPQRYHNNISLPTTMRAVPTTSTGAIDSGSGGALVSQMGSGGLGTSLQNFYQGVNNTVISSAWFKFDAEL